MESHKIENLLEKYFQGETGISEENELRAYFSGSDVAQHLMQYKPIFCYFSEAATLKSAVKVPLQSEKRHVQWLSIAASVVVLLGVGCFAYFNRQPQDLGTYQDPERAFRETQKALSLLSGNVNKGLESVKYVEEYESAKNRIFTPYE
ncbi:MAG: hypothetical protein EOO51_10880 [Flavobacterium sp.]|nr:MAG: hypothetical protein EOO51_10880 [Flavobacterium sp.]